MRWAGLGAGRLFMAGSDSVLPVLFAHVLVGLGGIRWRAAVLGWGGM